jgi:ubiquinone/menaquinone biosynthesis C-methylase UbiE
MSAILQLIAPIHHRLRSQKCDLFFNALQPQQGDSLLDVGGGTGIAGEFGRIYRYFAIVEVVNLDPQVIEEQGLEHVKCDVADGCCLPFPNRSFDWVFSNAVIEHVGGAGRQQRFAEEIRRVARKGYFVATPNRHFPIDPHTLLPFYQFLSPRWQSKVCRFSPGYLRSYAPIDLLSAGDLHQLFPQATVRKIGLPLFSNNLVVYRSLA